LLGVALADGNRSLDGTDVNHHEIGHWFLNIDDFAFEAFSDHATMVHRPDRPIPR